MTPEEQLEQWVAGNPIHNHVRNECCPDFSCCKPELLQPDDVRRAFADADEPLRHQYLIQFLGGAMDGQAPDVYIVGIDDAGDPNAPPAPAARSDWERLRTLTQTELLARGLRCWGREEDAEGHELPSGRMLMLFPMAWREHVPLGFEVITVLYRSKPFDPETADRGCYEGVLSFGVFAHEPTATTQEEIRMSTDEPIPITRATDDPFDRGLNRDLLVDARTRAGGCPLGIVMAVLIRGDDAPRIVHYLPEYGDDNGWDEIGTFIRDCKRQQLLEPAERLVRRHVVPAWPPWVPEREDEP